MCAPRFSRCFEGAQPPWHSRKMELVWSKNNPRTSVWRRSSLSYLFFGSLFLSYRRQLSLKGTISPRRIRRASEEAFRSSQLLPKSRDQQQFADPQKYFSNRVQMRLPLYLPRFQFRPSRFPCENSWHKQLAQQEARFLKLL